MAFTESVGKALFCFSPLSSDTKGFRINKGRFVFRFFAIFLSLVTSLFLSKALWQKDGRAGEGVDSGSRGVREEDWG